MPSWILDIGHWFATLPKEVVGPFFATCSGALIAFIGVNLQLRHNARQEDKKRLHELRKNELLQLAQVVPIGKAIITAQTGIRFNFEDYRKEVQAAIALANRATAIASMPTLEALYVLADHYQQAYVELADARLPLDSLNIQIDRIESLIKDIRSQREQLWRIADDKVGALPAEMMTYLKKRMEHLDADEEKQVDVLNGLMSERAKHLFKIAILSARHGATYDDLLSCVNINIRREMDLTIDDAAYTALVNRASKKTQERITAFIGSLEKRSSSLDAPKKDT